MKLTNLTCAAMFLALSTSALPAYAHISMKGALQSRGGDQKMSPCDGKRGDGPEYTFAPGATITLAVNEDIPHPSYFRIAFDDDGEDFVEPASIDPIDKTRACPFDKDDQCGKADYCTMAGASKGAVVLWDDLDPHLAAAAKGGSWTVKLPDVECQNCTLQVLQIMEDTVHGAYCPQGTCANSANSLEDIYHRCIDIKLVKGAASGPGVTMDAVKNNGMQCASDAPAGGAAGAAGGAAGAAGGAAGGPSAGAGGSAAAAGATAAAGGTTAAATGGSGGSTSSTSTSAPAAGSKSTSTGGSPAASAAGGSSAPASSSSSTTTAAAGSKSTGMTTGAATGASAGSSASEPAPASSSGGCSVAGTDRNDGAALGLLLSLGLVFARRRRS